MKKIHKNSDRSYRAAVRNNSEEISFQSVVEQTDLFILAQKDLSTQANRAIHEIRSIISSYIVLNPDFQRSLLPIEANPKAQKPILEMINGSKLCGVGPMAAVAGCVAKYVALKLKKHSPNIIVENGGDIYMESTRDRTVALLATPDSGSSIGLKIYKKEFPIAICSSSGTIGHSLSLGNGDLVTVKAKDACFADAAATALANLLNSPDDIELAIKQAQNLAPVGLDGVFIQYDSQIGAWGNMELCSL